MSYKDLRIKESSLLNGVKIIEPSVFEDLRGNIYTSFSVKTFAEHVNPDLKFVHDKFAESKHNVLRGLHGDEKTWKLVSCVWGEIFEVVADMRPGSASYLKWEAFDLSSADCRQVLIPPGFVNGYWVKSANAVFHYKLAYEGEYIDAGAQLTVKWNDPSLGIKWPCTNPILQERDR
jgi:dTDP-4-dehydrorhamnose 3,5-epimerase